MAGRSTPWPGTPPRRAHQNETCNRILRDGLLLVGDEPGLGKTRSAIDVIAYTRWRTLVVGPLRLIYSAWAPEVALWAPDLSFRNLHERPCVGHENIQAVNFETFKILVKSGERRTDQFDCIVVDESSKLKNPRSAISRVLLKFSRSIPHRIPMSGTPAPNGPHEYFAQLDLVERGFLGRSYRAFVNAWFSPTGHGDWRGKGNNIALRRDLEPAFMKLICQRAIIHRKADCLDLPEVTFVDVPVRLSPKERQAYDQMAELFWVLLEENPSVLGALREDPALCQEHVSQAPNVISALNSLRQICSGFAFAKPLGAEDAARSAVTIGDSKLAVAVDMLTTDLAGRSVVVIYSYRAEAERLVKAMPPGSVGLITGRTSAKRGDQIISEWREGKFPVLCFHPASCGHGITLTEASEMLWLSPTLSPELWEQAWQRIHRMGQQDPCTVYTLTAERTVEREIVSTIQKKQSLSDRMKEIGVKHLKERCA
jgi:SNF2 family DNA or RNA helicase